MTIQPYYGNSNKANPSSEIPGSLASIAGGIQNGFISLDHSWIIRSWNSAAEFLLGVRAEDIIGKNVMDVFAAVLPTDFYTRLNKVLRKAPIQYFEVYWAEFGAWFDVLVYSCNDLLYISFKNSQFVRTMALQTSRVTGISDIYRLVAELTNDCLWEWDLEANTLFWIDGFHKKAFGYPVQNALLPQEFWESLIHPEDRTRMLNKLLFVRTSGPGNVWNEEYRIKKANGEYAYVHDRGHIVFDESDKACRIIGATQDFTNHRLKEEQKSIRDDRTDSKNDIENKLAQEKLQLNQSITNAVLTAQEKERAHIGAELHDNVNQILGATKLFVEMAKTDESNRDMYLEKSTGYIVKVIDEIRRISRSLLPPGMQSMDVIDSLQNLCDDLALTQSIEVEFNVDGLKKNELTKKMQVSVFRIVQEQSNNILKHSGATQICIKLKKCDNTLVLIVSDNGKGCDPSIAGKGIGISNIIARAELYNGRVTILSDHGEGYLLKVVLPIHRNR